VTVTSVAGDVTLSQTFSAGSEVVTLSATAGLPVTEDDRCGQRRRAVCRSWRLNSATLSQVKQRGDHCCQRHRSESGLHVQPGEYFRCPVRWTNGATTTTGITTITGTWGTDVHCGDITLSQSIAAGTGARVTAVRGGGTH